jgi:hypothetical protein
MGIVTFDTIFFRMVIFDVLLCNGLLRTGFVDGVAFPAELPGVGFEQLFSFRMVSMQCTGTMTSFTGKITVVTFILHGYNGVVTGHTGTVSDKFDWMSSYLINGFPPVMTELAKGIGRKHMFKE